MLANADDGFLSTKDKSLPLTRSAIALSLKISVNKIQLFRRSQNTTCIVTCDCFSSKQSSRLSINLLRGVLVYKIQPLLHSLIASLMWSFHCVDLRPLLVSALTRRWETFPPVSCHTICRVNIHIHVAVAVEVDT